MSSTVSRQKTTMTQNDHVTSGQQGLKKMNCTEVRRRVKAIPRLKLSAGMFQTGNWFMRRNRRLGRTHVLSRNVEQAVERIK